MNVSSYYEASTIALEVSAKFNVHTNNKKNDCAPMSFDDWAKNNIQPRIGKDSYYSEDENGQYYWGLHKKYKAYLKDWENQNFGPDPQVWGTESNPPKAIEKIPDNSTDTCAGPWSS